LEHEGYYMTYLSQTGLLAKQTALPRPVSINIAAYKYRLCSLSLLQLIAIKEQLLLLHPALE